MTLSFKFGEFGDIQPIRCVDSQAQEVNIAFADVTKSFIYILTENKTKLLDTITSTDFTIVTPKVNWVPTKTQAEKNEPGNYSGEVHLQDTGLSKLVIFEFPIFIEKARGNIT